MQVYTIPGVSWKISPEDRASCDSTLSSYFMILFLNTLRIQYIKDPENLFSVVDLLVDICKNAVNFKHVCYCFH